MPDNINYLELSERLHSYADDVDTAVAETPDQVEQDLRTAATLVLALHKVLMSEDSD
jgi:hypothetical protein